MILRAAESLLARGGSGHVSMSQVAAAAGVGKGTVFRRFGSWAGLMQALLEERVLALIQAVASGPPPLGPGAPPRQRLAAFLDAVIQIAARNAAIMAAYDHAPTARESAAMSHQIRPVYQAWHAHISALIAEARPDLDAEPIAHILLGSLHSDDVRRMLLRGESERFAAALDRLATALLDSPATRDAPAS